MVYDGGGMLRSFLLSFAKAAPVSLAFFPLSPAAAAAPPEPFGAVPTKQQVNWQRMEWYAFVHFGLNTYTGREWGYGDESAGLFKPTDFNADEIVRVFKEAGMTGMIYTAKHHDGWCAWPTSSTKHNITGSPWKNGKGDVVKEFSEACRKHGLKFGTYLSPWDRNCAEYGRPGYLKVYYKQIEELLTKYGAIFEIWFDGANGGDGFYGGARQKRNIGNASDYYNYRHVVKMIRKLQPDCIVWGAGGHGDVKWGGSEKGHVPYPCRNTVGKNPKEERWVPLEGDTPINHAGWFWHPGQESRVKSPETLMQVYFDSVGRGANLILNVAPNRQGKLDAADVSSLLEFGEARRRLLAVDYARGAKVEADEVRGGDAAFGADKVTDGDLESYWCPNDGTVSGTLTLTLPKAVTFDVVRVREQIRLGQRVEAFTVEAQVDGAWQTIVAEGKTIGNQVMFRLPEAVTSDKLRVNILDARACPCISEVSLLKMPKSMPRPEISLKGREVRIPEQEGYTIVFTTNDNKLSGENAEEFTAGYKPGNGVFRVKAAYRDKSDGSIGPQTSIDIPLDSSGWKVEDKCRPAIDGDPDTLWISDKAPASFTIDMTKPQNIRAFSYTPRQDGKLEGMTDRYTLETSADGKVWKKISEGEFSNLRANPIEQKMEVNTKPVQFLRFTATRAIEGSGVSVADFKVFRAGDNQNERGKKVRKSKK